jgi:hypothetical protein
MSNKKNYGDSLAENVAVYLQNGKCLTYEHKEYCGTGLIFEDNVYYYCEVYDGSTFREILAFDTKKKFVTWLAKQTDYSMSRIDEEGISEFSVNNQCITKERLTNLAEWVERNEWIGVAKKWIM